jgi:hypothetical protein
MEIYIRDLTLRVNSMDLANIIGKMEATIKGVLTSEFEAVTDSGKKG